MTTASAFRRTLAILALATAARADAQAAAPAGCTYATCALRVDRGFWKTRLVRGVDEEEVSRLGGFGHGVDVLLTGPDSAAAHARTYVRDNSVASAFGLAAIAAYAVVIWRTDNFRGSRDLGTVGTAAAIVGAGTGITGAVYAARSTRELSRAIWWYNAALPH